MALLTFESQQYAFSVNKHALDIPHNWGTDPKSTGLFMYLTDPPMHFASSQE
jgi:hypothetical protein